jgi:hypothetical protein
MRSVDADLQVRALCIVVDALRGAALRCDTEEAGWL